jgi:23S rRNA pseudouridine1911/1915/1917 synthase
MSDHVFTVGAAEAGRTVAALLRTRLGLSWAAAKRLVHEERVMLAGGPCLDPARHVRRGQQVAVRPPSGTPKTPRADRSKPGPVIRFADAHVVVVDKPSGLTTMRHAEDVAEFGARARRFLPPTLADLLPNLLAAEKAGRPGSVRAVHRLDKETSGLVVFARTAEAERSLGSQFRAHTTDRRYLALVRGRAIAGRIESHLIRDRGDGRRGSGPESPSSQRAVTHVRILRELVDYTLVECRLETGRTHQVRIHLGEAGTPLCGERVYDRPPHGPPYPDGSGARRVALHAARLGFDHPATGERMTWESPLPADLRTLLQRVEPQRHKDPEKPKTEREKRKRDQ